MSYLFPQHRIMTSMYYGKIYLDKSTHFLLDFYNKFIVQVRFYNSFKFVKIPSDFDISSIQIQSIEYFESCIVDTFNNLHTTICEYAKNTNSLEMVKNAIENAYYSINTLMQGKEHECISLILIHEFIYNNLCYLGRTKQMQFQIDCNYINKNIYIKNLLNNDSILCIESRIN